VPWLVFARLNPLYTRPEDFRGMKVPEVLTNGNHAKIAEWKKEQTKE
jgi:tRNA (guanine37-N1)-methyltransferase